MAYNNIISRTDVQAMIAETVSDLMMNNLQTDSVALDMFTRLPISTNQTRFPVVSALPSAAFVTGDTGLKQTTEVNWANKYINVEEIAAIVPIPDAVLADSSFDIFGTVRPLLVQAIARLLDAAVIFGTSKPASWDAAVVPGAVAAGNVVERGTATQAEGGIAQDISALLATLEGDGYVPTGFIGNPLFKQYLRGARDANGQRLLDVSGTATDIWGLPSSYPMPGLWPTGNDAAELIAIQRQNFIVGVRQDFTFSIHNEGVITDAGGLVVYNLMQQDMTAIRVVFRCGYAVANELNYQEAVEANRFPAAVLRSPGA